MEGDAHDGGDEKPSSPASQQPYILRRPWLPMQHKPCRQSPTSHLSPLDPCPLRSSLSRARTSPRPPKRPPGRRARWGGEGWMEGGGGEKLKMGEGGGREGGGRRRRDAQGGGKEERQARIVVVGRERGREGHTRALLVRTVPCWCFTLTLLTLHAPSPLGPEPHTGSEAPRPLGTRRRRPREARDPRGDAPVRAHAGQGGPCLAHQRHGDPRAAGTRGGGGRKGRGEKALALHECRGTRVGPQPPFTQCGHQAPSVQCPAHVTRAPARLCSM